MFPTIRTINDVLPFIATKKEIASIPGPAGSTTICYQFQDSETFDSPQARECRGIVFDRDGNIAARPLHKFFNLGEHGETADSIDASQVFRVMDKLDGSMIHTVWLDNEMRLKSKKSFDNAQTKLAWGWLNRPENAVTLQFCRFIAYNGYTAIFELTSLANRVVVPYADTQMRLLHIRQNVTGHYAPRAVLEYFAKDGVPLVDEPCTVADALASIPAMDGKEGYIIQFNSGEMLKVKCPWYLQLHRTVSFTRERDIAEAALAERLDDIKAALAGLGHDLAPINAIETAVKTELVAAQAQVEAVLAKAAGMERKDFAVSFKDHALFSLLMPAYNGKAVDYAGWYRRNHLKSWSLNPVGDIALEDA